MGGRKELPAAALAAMLLGLCSAGDPYAYFDWNVAYMKAAPLGVEQQVCSVVNSRYLSRSFFSLWICEISFLVF